MRVQVLKKWDRIRSSFWFIPTVMAGGAMTLAFFTVSRDTQLMEWLKLNWGVTFNGGAAGASSLLASIAGSMITIAGVVFSMTLVALSLASSQLGPRLLRNLMRDTTTQMVLGTFVATFLYCLLVLRTIRRAEEVLFVPHLSVALSVIFTVLSVGVLIYFIHHVSISIQANEIVARVGKELIKGIEQVFPQNIGHGSSPMLTLPSHADFLNSFEREAFPILSKDDGYLQIIDGDALIAMAMQEDFVIRVERLPGDYIVATRPLVLIWPGSKVTKQVVECVNSAFALGNQRTSVQDVEFLVNQLVEIAVRALSPGVNDPFTAITCLDNLGSALCRLAKRDMPSPYRYDTQDKLRVITPILTFPNLLDTAFNQIRQYSHSSTAVTIRLLETIAEVARFAHRPEDRVALLLHAKMIARGSVNGLSEERDRQDVEKCFQLANYLLSDSPNLVV